MLYLRYRFGAGIGAQLFNLNNESKIKFGLMENVDYLAFYLDADIALDDHFIIQPGARFGKYPVYGIGLSYRWH